MHKNMQILIDPFQGLEEGVYPRRLPADILWIKVYKAARKRKFFIDLTLHQDQADWKSALTEIYNTDGMSHGLKKIKNTVLHAHTDGYQGCAWGMWFSPQSVPLLVQISAQTINPPPSSRRLHLGLKTYLCLPHNIMKALEADKQEELNYCYIIY